MFADGLEDTIVALATPQPAGSSSGAIAVIRLSGARAIAIAESRFKGKKLSEQPSHSLHFGLVCDASGGVVDEVLVSVFRAPHSYTGEDSVEISCHASPYIIRRVLDLLMESGARMARPGEFSMRAFYHGKMDLARAEAVADLIAARSKAAHELALRQMRGGVSSEISSLREELIHFAGMLELELDFGEEDVEFADRSALRQMLDRVRARIAGLMETFTLGQAIKEGVHTVLAGRPNAGKSTLLNALLQEERAIVSDIPGTTRDTIEEVLDIRGVLFRLMDTAGLREADDRIEALGVERTLQKIATARVLVYVYDQTVLSAEEVLADLQRFARPDLQVLILANKADLLGDSAAVETGSRLAKAGYSHWLSISAHRVEDIKWVSDALYSLVVEDERLLESPMISSLRHLQALRSAETHLAKAEEGLRGNLTSDLIAWELRQTLHHLGEITGEITTDDLLDNIFSNFCIGK